MSIMYRPADAVSLKEQQGQAMSETLVVMLALVPFFVALPLIARYQDMRHATLAASRTAAFECSVRFERCGNDQQESDVIANQIRRRHFSRHHIDVHSGDVASDETLAAQRNPFWHDSKGNSMLASYADVTLDIKREKADAIKKLNFGNLNLSSAVEKFAKFAGPDAFGMPIRDGLITAQVQSKTRLDQSWLRHLPAGFTDTLNFSEKTVVLVDGWHASSAKGPEARSFQNRVEQGRRLPSVTDLVREIGSEFRLAPQGRLERWLPDDGVEKALDLLYQPVRFGIREEGKLSIFQHRKPFRYHEIDVEILPQDRLKSQ